MNEEMMRKIENEHDEAMEHASIGDVHKRKGNMEDAIESYTTAYGMERWCAENVPEDCEPSRSIMYSSAISLANAAGLKKEAKELAEKLLSFTTYEEYVNEATELLAELKNIE